MEIIIAGMGRVGYAVATELSKEKHNITIIDHNSEKSSDVSDTLDVFTLQGNIASPDTLLKAGADKADLLIAVTESDETNLLCALIAKKLGVQKTIVRVKSRDYYNQAAFLKDDLGLALIIAPQEVTANEISRILRFPAASKVEPFAHGRAESVEMRISVGSPLEGLQMSKFHNKFTDKVLVCAVSRGNDIFIPKGDFVLQAGDRLNIIGAYKEINYFLNKTIGHKRGIKTVILLGGGKTAFYLARQLTNAGMKVKIIEKNKDICAELSSTLPKVELVLADGTRADVLNEEGITSADAFVALTGDDEDNVISSMYAQSVGVKKVITKVNENHIARMLTNGLLDSVMQPSSIATQRIVGYVRSMQNAYDSSVEALYYMFEGRVEALELFINSSFPYTEIPLRNLKLSKDTLISAIIRDGMCIIPNGDDVINVGDSVIVTTSRSGVLRLEDVMEAII